MSAFNATLSDFGVPRRSAGWEIGMVWATPQHSLNQVDKAGKNLVKDGVSPADYQHALGVINNWRASHQYPLNTFQMTLRRKAKKTSAEALVYQRIKRLPSIERKLRSGTMQLSQMQDIGGCRAVLESLDHVATLRKAYASAEFDHQFKGEKDYINSPKDDGYRSFHLIYRYRGRDKTSCYNNLQIEIQLRSSRQHAWATAVEAVGTFTKQALKWRGGDQEWRRFFVLMSSAIASMEMAPLVENTPKSKRQLAREIRSLSGKLSVQNTLRAYNLTLDYVGSLKRSKARLLLVHMLPDESKVQVTGFRLDESQKANEMYSLMEGRIAEGSADQVVLVKVDSLNSLRRAYPNLFLDTVLFSALLGEVLEWA